MKRELVQRHGLNVHGRDFAVGDIHAHYTELELALKGVGFNPSVDRLFSVGDLVDRGAEPQRSLEFLDYPWFFACLGNHEESTIMYGSGNWNPRYNYLDMGGAWFMAMMQDERFAYVDAFRQLPVLMEVETANGPVGLVHSDVIGNSWPRTIQRYEMAKTSHDIFQLNQTCLWDRNRVLNSDHSGVEGIRAMVVGHTPLRRAAVLGNVYCIDSGGWREGGHFTLLDLTTLQMYPGAKPALDWS